MARTPGPSSAAPQAPAPGGPAAAPGAPAPVPPARKGFFRRRLLPGLLLLLVLLLLSGTAAVFWLRTPAGQERARQELVSLLAPSLAAQGLELELTRLGGALPLELDCALRLRDAAGPWLDLPRARAALGLEFFPPRISLELRLERPALYRLPQLPPAPGDPATPLPLTLAAVEDGLRGFLEGLGSLPGWLPSLHVREIALEKAWLGRDVLTGGTVPAGCGTSLPLSAMQLTAVAAAALDGELPAATPDDPSLSPAGHSARAQASATHGPAAASPAGTAATAGRDAVLPSATSPSATPVAGAGQAARTAQEATSSPGAGPAPVPGVGLVFSLSLTADAAFSSGGAEARADVRADWSLATVRQPAAAPASGAPPAVLPATPSGAAAPALADASPATGGAAAPLLPEDEGHWLPAPLALLLTPGQASSLQLALALTPGPQPRLALESLGIRAGAVELHGRGALELVADGDALTSPLELSCALEVADRAAAAPLLPQARTLLAPLAGKLRLELGVAGSLGAPEPRLRLACAALDLDGHALDDAGLSAGGRALPWPRLAARGRLELPLELRARTGGDQIVASLCLLAGREGEGWLLGLPHLAVQGAGGRLEGALLALLPDTSAASTETAATTPATAPEAPAHSTVAPPVSPAPAAGRAALPAGASPGASSAPPSVPPASRSGSAGHDAPSPRPEAAPPAPAPLPAGKAAAAAPAILAEDFAPARLLAALFPEARTAPRFQALLRAEMEDWAALDRVLGYWLPGLRLDGRGKTARLELRAGGLPVAGAAPATPAGAPATPAAWPPPVPAPAPASDAGPVAGPAASPPLPAVPAASSAASPATAPGASSAAASPSSSVSPAPGPTAPAPALSPGLAAQLAALPQDAAFLSGEGWQQWVSLDGDVDLVRLRHGGGELFLVRELRQRLRLEDVFGQGRLEQRLDVRQLHVAGWRLERVLLALKGALATPLEAELACAGDVQAKLRLRWQGNRLEAPVCDLRLRQGVGLALRPGMDLTLDGKGLSLRGLDARLTPAGRIRGTASLTPGGMDVRLALENTDLAPWAAVVPGLPAATVAFQSRLHGSPAAPAGDFRLDVRRLAVPQASLPPLDLALSGKLGGSGGKGRLELRLELPPSTRQLLGAAQAGLEARLPLRFSANGLPLPDMAAPLSGRLDWQGRLAPLWQLVPVADRRVTGGLDMHLALAGSLSAPTCKGRLAVTGGRYEDLALGILLTDIRATVTAGSGKGLKLEPVHLDAAMSDGRGGLVTASGSLQPAGGALDLQAAMKRLRPLRRSDIQATLSGTATVRGTLSAPQVTADITIDEAQVNIDRLAGSSVTTLPVEGTSEAPEPAPAAKEGRGSLDVRIQAPGRIAVNGHGLESEWKAGLRVRGALNDPLVIGSVRSVRGQFNLLSKLFTLRPSTISFNGGAVSNPLLDVTLRYEVPEITADVRVSGSVRRMKLELSSTPSLPQEEIISRVMFGRGSSELGRFESLRLAAAVAQLAGFGSGGLGIFDLGRTVLGVDVLRINSSTDKDSGDEESSLEVGKFIGEKIYLGVEQGLEPDSTAVIMELELTPHSKLGVRTEQDNTSAGFQWKKNY